MARRPATSPRKNASQERSRATVDALLAATARVLVRDGYDHASTNKIAEAAGVSIGSLYQYFPSKEALVAAVIERHIGEMMDVVRTSLVRVAALPLREAARELVRVMIEAHRIEPKLHRVLVEQIPRVGNMEHVERVDEEATALVRAYLEARRDEIGVEDLDMAAFLAVSSVEAMTHAAVLRRPALLSEPRFVDEVAALVVRYLEGDAATSGARPAMLAAE
ncbi:MAG: TetR family transcriptional regulator [Labilithrix sp.]|nr:TetR family transcriptional regulator [Labilithrix sp.]MBX3224105.1 TetR family transcriptional regulator [Labilithrix sp.]